MSSHLPEPVFSFEDNVCVNVCAETYVSGSSGSGELQERGGGKGGREREGARRRQGLRPRVGAEAAVEGRMPSPRARPLAPPGPRVGTHTEGRGQAARERKGRGGSGCRYRRRRCRRLQAWP